VPCRVRKGEHALGGLGELVRLANLHWANLIGQTGIGEHALAKRS